MERQGARRHLRSTLQQLQKLPAVVVAPSPPSGVRSLPFGTAPVRPTRASRADTLAAGERLDFLGRCVRLFFIPN